MMEESFLVLPKSLPSRIPTSPPSTSSQAPSNPARESSTPARGGDGAPGLWPAAEVFRAVSERSGVQHPVCLSCSRAVREGMEREVERVQEESNRFRAALERLKAGEGENLEALERELERQVKALEVEEQAQLREQARLTEEHRRLVEETDAAMVSGSPLQSVRSSRTTAGQAR